MTLPAPKQMQMGLFTALSGLAKGSVTDAAVFAVIGDAVATTHAEVGRFLGVAANTIKQSWAPEGMPGEQGNYPIAAIVAWRLKYLAELERRKRTGCDTPDDELELQQKREDLLSTQLKNQSLEIDLEIKAKRVVDREAFVSAWKADNAVLEEHAEKLPEQKWSSLMQPEQAEELIPIFVADIRRLFTAHSEGRVADHLAEDADEIDP